MCGGFRELENITADLGIEAWGQSIEDAFANTAGGLACLISNLPSGRQPLSRRIRIEADSLTSLLVRFLNEIIYLEETLDFLPGKITHIKIQEHNLDADMTGAIFDPDIHTIHTHIKAATYHGLEIEKTDERVTIKVIFDV